MSLKIEVKTWIHGRRRMLFERLKNKKEANNAALLREILDFYFKNHRTPSPKLYLKSPLYIRTRPPELCYFRI